LATKILNIGKPMLSKHQQGTTELTCPLYLHFFALLHFSTLEPLVCTSNPL